ncbi:bestrophin family protein [Ideonella livida]|uniref:Bestrophin n=1 Tax=Ideonella livida TaxID=2707176 RepID=A0A7C9PKG4_9BURK|nr:bestrophin family ion channel [Ideonella livida]NDY93310.1 hypothetical protein [Ideonella livida]
MIVRPRQHWLQLLLVWHGSVLRHILFRLGLNGALAIFAVCLMPWLKGHGLELSTAPFSLIGIALAIFLGFRNSVSYDRFWEARKLWGGLLVASRCLLRQAQTLTGRAPTDPAVREFCHLLVALASVLRHQLRHSLASPAAQADLQRLLPADLAAAVARAQYPCVRLLRELAAWVRRQHTEGRLSEVAVQSMDRNLDELTLYHGSCERIAATPIPYAYSVLLHRTVTVYCTLLPFSLVSAAGVLTPVVSVFIAYAFMALDAIACELEEPFGTEPNDLPLNAMCLTIERSLLELCDADSLPLPASPDRFHVLD